MMKKLLISLALFTSLVALPVGLAPSAYAENPLGPACSKLSADERKQSAACSNNPNDNPLTGPNGLINNIANIVAIVAGAAAVIIIIVQGIAMVTSAGDTQRVQQARNGVLAAVAGLVVIVMAKTLITFVVNKL